jgi:hypothetical protein
MSDKNRRPEDIADLFLKFGGDPHAYQEFKPRITPGSTTVSLVQVVPVPPAVPAKPALPRELDAFFARLAGLPAAVGAHGLLSRWRRQV